MQIHFSDGSVAEYSYKSEHKPYMLFCGTAHDRELRLKIVLAAKEAGFTVRDADGPFGTVIVDARNDQIEALRGIQDVTSAGLFDGCGCLSSEVCPTCDDSNYDEDGNYVGPIGWMRGNRPRKNG